MFQVCHDFHRFLPDEAKTILVGELMISLGSYVIEIKSLRNVSHSIASKTGIVKNCTQTRIKRKFKSASCIECRTDSTT